MWFVYVLTSERHPKYVYIGFTGNVLRRFKEHSAQNSKLASAPYQPLKLAGYIAVVKKDIAVELERYLKSGSGKAFLHKRILN